MADAAAVSTTPDSDPQTAQPLSPLHVMVVQVDRDLHPGAINRVVNHPEVYEWVRGHNLGRLDLGPLIANRANILLMGEHGGLLFQQHQPGLFEVHTAILPEGRGPWAHAMARACLHIMFTQHTALEIMTRVPKGNLGARVLTKMCGFEYEFTRSAALGGFVYKGDPIPADIFSLTIQQWMRGTPGLVERGHWFHQKLEDEYRRHGKTEPTHPDDLVHDRYVGAAVEMLFGGQIVKAFSFYNRWAGIAGYQPIQLMTAEPLSIDIGAAVLCFRNNDFWVMSCR